VENNKNEVSSIALTEVQLLLAEKRTSLAVMRTGVAVIALPLSILGLLIATSKYYDVIDVLRFLVPLGVINLILVFLGAYLILRSLIHMRHYDHLIQKIKRQDSAITEFID